MKGGNINIFAAAFLPTIVKVRHGNIFQNSINQTIMTNPNEPIAPIIDAPVMLVTDKEGNQDVKVALDKNNTDLYMNFDGLTKREYMATKLMAAMMATENFDTDFKNVARMAVEATDDLINALNKEDQS